MNENRSSRGPSWGLLLLIPAALIIAKGARRRRAMWGSGWSESGFAGRGHGHHRGFGGGAGEGDPRAAFKLPPKIEWMLETWHTRAHQTADAPEPPTAAESTTA